MFKEMEKFEISEIQFSNEVILQKRYTLEKNVSFLAKYKKWTWIVLFIASILQCLFFFTLDNVFAVACVLICWFLVDEFILYKLNFQKYTISTIIIFGFSLTQFCFPTILILLEGKPLVYNLKSPYNVFLHSFLALIILICAHYIYKKWRRGVGFALYNSLNSLLRKHSFFTPPTDLQVWIIGVIGVICMIFNFYNGYSEEKLALGGKGVLEKFLQGFMPYAYTPFLLLIKPLYNNKRTNKSKIPKLKIIYYALLLLFVGILGNSRSLFMTGITTAGIAYLLGLLIGKFSFKVFNFKNTILLLIGVWLIIGPLSNLGTAIVLVRGLRNEISNDELIVKTIQAYQDENALELYKVNSKKRITDWDESYFDNIFLARFCNLKFNDASLEMADKIGHIDKKMFEYSVNKFWSVLPQPLLSLIGVDANKKEVISNSYGDYLFFRAGGSNALGGFRTGQFAGTGLAAFGWWYLVLLGFGAILLFFLVDLFVYYKKSNNEVITSISIIGLTSMTVFFTFFSTSQFSESVVNIYTYTLRNIIQLVVIYWILFSLSKKISNLI